LLKRNVGAFAQKAATTPCHNYCRLSAMQMQWGDKTHLRQIMAETGENSIDIVIAADVVQWPDVVEPLLHTVKALLWNNKNNDASIDRRPHFLLGIVSRATNTYNLFFRLAKELGFTTEFVRPEECFLDGIVPDTCREFGGRTAEVHRVTLSDRSVEPVLLSCDNIDRTTSPNWSA
jgi:hypothetical protein